MTAPGNLASWEPSAEMRQARDEVARAFGVDPLDLVGRGRLGPVLQARNAACWALRRRFGLSYPCLGKLIGGRDHSTVIHACRLAAERRASDAGYRALTDALAAGITLPPPAPPREEQVRDAVARAFMVTPAQLIGPSRAAWLVAVRHAAVWVLRQVTPLNLQDCGHLFGGRDHKTMAHAVARAEERRSRDPHYRALTDQLVARWSGPDPVPEAVRHSARPGRSGALTMTMAARNVRARNRFENDPDAAMRFHGTNALVEAIAASGGGFR